MEYGIVKKTKISSLVGCNSRPPELPVDLLVQVFVRLPIRQLFKCMFVSKFWCSIIRLPAFIQTYWGRNPFCLLLSVYQIDRQCELSLSRSFYCSNILHSGQQEFFNFFNFSRRRGTHSNRAYCGVTQIINGFFCAYMGNRVLLVNVFTGQVTGLPCPPIRPNAMVRYYFGFEPITGLYKLLCIDSSNLAHSWKQPRQGRLPEGTLHDFYILTMSGSAQEFPWRRLPLPEAYDNQFYLFRQSISVDGALHWIFWRKGSICCFDLTTEEFVYVDTNVGDILREDEISRVPCLVQFRGKVSLFYCKGRDMIIRSLETDNSWTVHEVTLPEEFPNPARILVDSLSKGPILLAYPELKHSITQVYTYDNKFERVVVAKFPQSVNLAGLHIHCLEQNIEMLEALFRRFSPRY